MPLAPYRRNRSSTKCYQITLGSLGKLLLLSPKRFLGESLPLTFFPHLFCLSLWTVNLKSVYTGKVVILKKGLEFF